MDKKKEKINVDLNNLISRLTNRREELELKSRKFSIYRLITFIIGLTLFLGFYFYSFKTTAISFGISFTAVFIFLMIIHNKIEKSIKKYNAYLEIKHVELARSNLDWNNIPFSESIIIEQPNSIEQDLNITEKNGLIHLIYNGKSIEGVNLLRRWLINKIRDFDEIVEKQKIIKELIALNHFRNRLKLITSLSFKEYIEKVEIVKWLKEERNKKGLKLFTTILSLLCVINLALFLGSIIGFFDKYYYQVLLFYILFYYTGAKFIKDIHLVSGFLFDEVRRFSKVFGFIENYNFGKNKNVKKSVQSFLNPKNSPTKTLSKINFTVEVLNLRANPFIWFALMVVLPIDYLLSIKVENFRNSVRNYFPKWLDEWYNLEAFCSLAEFAHLNPNYTFASFDENINLLETEKMGHPLIKANEKIVNDFEISSSTSTNIVTGSNMSGKSTFLRTVGINLLLANAGSVVNADKFTLAKLNLYTCIKVSDSVVDGISYFYAEVKRLKKILEEINNEDNIALVLIDEIYKGTNNIERVVGSKALIKHLAEQNIYNIVSTHDLELVKITDEVHNSKNYHFRELIEKNKMTFDYKLLEGPCPTTNALKIMRQEGLPT